MDTNPNPITSANQTVQIRAALENGEKLTPMDALNRFGCFRLGARIWDLRHQYGMDIRMELKPLPGGKRVAEYSLA